MDKTRIVITLKSLESKSVETLALFYVMLPLTVHQSSEIYRLLIEKTGSVDGADHIIRQAKAAYNSIA